MSIRYQVQYFSSIDSNDVFFDTLKDDYPEFPQWFDKKANSGATALVFSDDDGLGAFVYLKSEIEKLYCKGGMSNSLLKQHGGYPIRSSLRKRSQRGWYHKHIAKSGRRHKNPPAVLLYHSMRQ